MPRRWARTLRGFDGGKLIEDRKRNLAVDMRGMAPAVMVTPAAPHDSIPALDQLFRLRRRDPIAERRRLPRR